MKTLLDVIDTTGESDILTEIIDRKMETLKTIKAGTTLTARSIGDYNCIFKAEVISRTNSFAKVKVEGKETRCKIHVYDNTEMIYALGQYCMAPVFKAV